MIGIVARSRGGHDRLRVLALLATVLVATGCAPGTDVARVEGFAQGTTYGAQWMPVPGAHERAVRAALEAELARLDAIFSNYRADSAVERFNAARTTEALDAPAELVTLLRTAVDVQRASAGCFDPTVRPLVASWGFDGTEPRVPEPTELESARRLVGLGHLEMPGDTQLKKRLPELAVDVSGIAQGYTAARLAAVLETFGIERYLVEIGGEIAARGSKPNGERWRVAIETPSADDGRRARVMTLPERRSAIATSGTYQHFFSEDGRRYAHVLDPRTGRPVEHRLVSVTVLHADGALADAWSTALLCLGPEDAQAVATREEIAAVLLIERAGGLEEWLSPAVANEWTDVVPRP